MTYPTDDPNFAEGIVTTVAPAGEETVTIQVELHMYKTCFAKNVCTHFIQSVHAPLRAKIGDTVRIYPDRRNMHGQPRGLFINGEKVWFREEASV